MRYKPTVKGKLKKSAIKQPTALDLAQNVGSVASLVHELNFVKQDVIQTVDQELERVDEKLQTVDEKVEYIENAVKEMKALEKGDPGQDADEQKIADWVLKQIRQPKDGKDADEESIVSKTLSRLPKPPSEGEIVAKVLKQLPENKASLKIIKEELKLDKEALLDEFINSPKLKLKIGNIDGLKVSLDTLDRRYIHGGGDTVVAGSNITITTNGNGAKVISSAAGSGLTVGTTTITSGTTTRILYDNAGTLGEYTISGSGTQVAMATAPTFATSITGSYLTASEILITDASKNIVSAPVATYPSLTELSYVKGVTSAIQTQLGTKAPTANPTFTGVASFANGTSGAPSIAFASEATLGFYRSSATVMGLNGGLTLGSLTTSNTTTLTGVIEVNGGTGYAKLYNAGALAWSSTGAPSGSGDLFLKRSATKVLSITGDGTGATTNAGWLLGYSGTSGYATLVSSSYGTVGTSAGFIQGSAGDIFMRAPSGQTVSLGTGANEIQIVNSVINHQVRTTIAAGTAVTDVNALNITQTWNEGATAFTAIKLNVTDTTSAATSTLMDLQVGGASQLTIYKTGRVVSNNSISGYAGVYVSNPGASFGDASRSLFASPTDGVMTISNNAGTDFARLQLGGTTSSFPAIKRSSAAIAFRLADDSADAAITAAGATLSGTLALAANSITMTGSIAATGARVTKGWFTDIESTNMPTVGGTSIASTFAPIASPTFTGTVTLPTVSLTGAMTLAENASINLDSVLSADGKYTGETMPGTAGATLAFGDLVYLAAADSRWELTDADSATTGGPVLVGMCVLAAASDGDPTTILMRGTIRADAAFPALTISAPVYLGETAGDIQTAIPTGADNVIRVVGFALTADSIYFNPSPEWQITVA